MVLLVRLWAEAVEGTTATASAVTATAVASARRTGKRRRRARMTAGQLTVSAAGVASWPSQVTRNVYAASSSSR